MSRETKFSGANGDRQENIRFPYSADHEQDWQPHAVDPKGETISTVG